MLEVLLVATGTALATGLGAVPVFFLGRRARMWRPALLGGAAGVMTVASIDGLLVSAFREGGALDVLAGLGAGVLFLLLGRAAFDRAPSLTGTGRRADLRVSILVFGVLFVHSLPEGFAIGTAYASSTEGLATFVAIAIAIQNIPEGTSVALPLAAAGVGRARQFWAAVATSAPQPVGAALSYVLVAEISALLPFSFGFAAGAMLALVAVELMPEAWRENARTALLGAGVAAALMLALSRALAV
jgi:zinc transporter, ZIP family